MLQPVYDKDTHITLPEASKMLGFTARTLERWAKGDSGPTMPYYLPPGCIRNKTVAMLDAFQAALNAFPYNRDLTGYYVHHYQKLESGIVLKAIPNPKEWYATQKSN